MKAHVLDAQVDALAQLAVAHDLGDFDADRALVHVENDAGAAVVVAVRHAAGLRRVALDVHVVTALERRQEDGQRGDTLRLERLAEAVARARADTEGVRHLRRLPWYLLNKTPTIVYTLI